MLKEKNFISGTELSILKEAVGCTLKEEEREKIELISEQEKLEIKKSILSKIENGELPLDILELTLEFQAGLEADEEKRNIAYQNVWNLIISIAKGSNIEEDRSVFQK